MLIVSRGDGTALLQTRERHCDSEIDDCFGEIPWVLSAQQLCALDIPAELADACACGEDSCEGCYWDPFFNGLVDCKPVEEISCEDLLALVGE
jgi:hypothetical protein